MPATDTLTPEALRLLHALVDRLQFADAALQEHLMKYNGLLQTDAAALHWFLDNINDSWRVSPKAIYEYVRMWAPRIVFTDHFPFTDRSDFTDGTRFVLMVCLHEAWSVNGDQDDKYEKEILHGYEKDHLHPQFLRLLCTGAIGRDVILQVPQTMLHDNFEIKFYTFETPKLLRDSYAVYANDNIYAREDMEKIYALCGEHFRKNWLPALLSETEYDAVKDLALNILCELYPAIWDNGPALLRAAYIAKVTKHLVYDYTAKEVTQHA